MTPIAIFASAFVILLSIFALLDLAVRPAVEWMRGKGWVL